MAQKMNNFEKIEYFSKKRCGKIWWIQKKEIGRAHV